MKLKLGLRSLMLLVIFCLFTTTAYANSAEPPTLIVLLKNASADTSVAALSGDSVSEGRRSTVAWETCYVFYRYELGDGGDGVTLRMTGNGESYELPVDARFTSGYNSVVTLDFASRSLSEGKLLSRSALLVGLRVTLTLLIEGLVFFLMGFRQKRSWVVFLVMNLLTQGALNLLLNQSNSFTSYPVLNLIVMEFWVFLVEIIGVLALIREHGRLRRVGFVLLANLLSLILGGWLITALPV